MEWLCFAPLRPVKTRSGERYRTAVLIQDPQAEGFTEGNEGNEDRAASWIPGAKPSRQRGVSTGGNGGVKQRQQRHSATPFVLFVSFCEDHAPTRAAVLIQDPQDEGSTE